MIDQFPLGFGFRIVDAKTGKEPDLEKICREDWAKNLMAMDIEGWMIEEDGTLCLGDECGNFAYAPEGEYKIVLEGTLEQIADHDARILDEAAERVKSALMNAWVKKGNKEITVAEVMETVDSAVCGKGE